MGRLLTPQQCSGATQSRQPGYYDDLVAQSQRKDSIDPEIVQQIKVDIGRTLTDNTFFRHGPGIARLEEVLKAYAIHNSRIGYWYDHLARSCTYSLRPTSQGMNLITGSLLIICATTEDVFWLLVAIIDSILPSGYFSGALVVARADQTALRSYVAELLPSLSARLEELGVELEALTFQWFLSLFTAVVNAEALYRIWDVILCLNSSDAAPTGPYHSATSSSTSNADRPVSVTTAAARSNLATSATNYDHEDNHDGTSSPFLFQLALALLKLNEPALLALESPAAVYSYVNHDMTNHAISIDGLIGAAEALRGKIRRAELLERRAKAVREIFGR